LLLAETNALEMDTFFIISRFVYDAGAVLVLVFARTVFLFPCPSIPKPVA
jgi:hypothetical protein